MTLDELNALADDLGLPGDTQIIVHEPEVGFWTIEGLNRPNYGDSARLVIQPDTFFDTEA